MADGMKTVLQAELEKAKENLKDVDENIKRITGRDPNDARQGLRRVPVPLAAVGDFRGRDRLVLLGGRREAGGLDGGPASKRRAVGGAFTRLGPRIDSRRPRGEDSGEEEDLPKKPTLQSSIVATPKELKTRKDCIEEQKSDSRGMARNRRMFGLLLGTLQKFKDEESQKKEKEQKRIEIEKKLEAAAEQEKEALKKERQDLFVERRKRQADLRRLEQKMELVKQQEEWEGHRLQLMPFIQTRTKPSVFYLPNKHTPATEERLLVSQRRLQEMMMQRRRQTEEELQSMDRNCEIVEETVYAGDTMMEEGMEEEEEEEIAIPMDPIKMEEDEEEAGKENNPEAGNTAEGRLRTVSEGESPDLVEQDGDAHDSKVVLDVEKEVYDTVEAEPEKEAEVEQPFINDQNLLTEKEFEPIYD